MNQIPTNTFTTNVPPSPVAPQIILPIPLSYEFQVVEHVDANDKITKVELQMKVNQHDQFGYITVPGNWTIVPRIQVKI